VIKSLAASRDLAQPALAVFKLVNSDAKTTPLSPLWESVLYINALRTLTTITERILKPFNAQRLHFKPAPIQRTTMAGLLMALLKINL
jgi:hypothetical protein